MRKREIKRYNGEEDSFVEDYASLGKRAKQKESQESDELDEYFKGKYKRPDLNLDTIPGHTTAEYFESQKAEVEKKYGSGKDKEDSGPKSTAPAETSKTFNQAFAEARAKAIKGGPKTFTWNGKKYGTELAKKSSESSKPVVASKTEVRESVTTPKATTKTEQYPVYKTDRKEKIEDVIKETPLANPRGGLDILNVLRRNQRMGAESMKESGRQARVDKIRRNVGSNLETYGMKKGGKVSSASSRADGAAIRGKTKGRIC